MADESDSFSGSASNSASSSTARPMLPAAQVRDAIVRHLQSVSEAWETPLPLEQIRAALDLTGEPKGTSGIAVSCLDRGAFGGMPTRILVELEARVVVYSHLEDDLSGALADALEAQCMDALSSIEYALDGWRVSGTNGRGAWAVGEHTLSGSYRQAVLTATIHIHKADSSRI